MNAWLKNLGIKLLAVFEKFILVIVTKIVDFIEAVAAMVIKQFSTFNGTVVALIVLVIICELVGIKVIGLSLDVLKNFIAVMQPIIWPIAIVAIIWLILRNK